LPADPATDAVATANKQSRALLNSARFTFICATALNSQFSIVLLPLLWQKIKFFFEGFGRTPLHFVYF
jgi:hypothetical protein